jgi:hypothetical protein
MNNPTDIRDIVRRVIEAYVNNDASEVPLDENVVHRGPMIPAPLRGAAAVRRHMTEIAPFVARMELKRLVTEGESAAVIFEYEGVNGVVIDGAEFFLIRDGLICEQQVFFDTGPLLRGRS